MNMYINQTIRIHQIKITGLTNSSVFQIGSAGIIKPISNLFNSGGFTDACPPLLTEPDGPPLYVRLPAPSA
ncbi:spore germination protein GerPB [Terrilactibacillus sp. S3-3]|nr:spore germination protein GerPB [Terrilactibacillus sp. S3-3]